VEVPPAGIVLSGARRHGRTTDGAARLVPSFTAPGGEAAVSAEATSLTNEAVTGEIKPFWQDALTRLELDRREAARAGPGRPRMRRRWPSGAGS
jgi:hypothetical protein